MHLRFLKRIRGGGIIKNAIEYFDILLRTKIADSTAVYKLVFVKNANMKNRRRISAVFA